MYSLTPRMPSASLRENLVILWEVILCFRCHLKSLGGWAGHPDNSMTRMDPQSYFYKLNCLGKNTTTQQPVRISILSFILTFVCHVNGCIINANRCCLRLVNFFSFFWCIILSLCIGCATVLQHVLFSQWPYSVLFYSMHKTVCICINEFTFVVDTTKWMSILLCPPLAFPATVMMMMMMVIL